jgi:hypothetical protein
MTLDDLTRAGTEMLMVLIAAARNGALARARPVAQRSGT